MTEKTLVVEGLPGDFDDVRSRLDFYFKSKRKSGGETTRMSEHPEDKRKALLGYADDNDVKNVLERTHQVDFKDLGTAELKVTMQEEEEKSQNRKSKPRVPPKVPKKPIPAERILPRGVSSVPKVGGMDSHFSKGGDVETPPPHPSPTSLDPQSSTESPKEKETNIAVQTLIVSSTEAVHEDVVKLYFEQFSENIEIKRHGTNSWMLKLESPADLLKIVDVKEHEFGFMVEMYDDGTEVEEYDPRRFVITGFDESCQVRVLTLFINSCSPKVEYSWELLDDYRVVVTFKKDIDTRTFLGKCGTKLQSMDIKASLLEHTDSVLVQGDMSQIKEEMIKGYFSDKVKSRGGDITSFNWVSKSRSAVITFKDYAVAYRVVEKKHHLSGADLTALLFYSSLQKALTGETPTLSGVKTNIAIFVNRHIRNYIEKNRQCKDDLQKQLKGVRTNVQLDKTLSANEITVEMNVDKESLAALQLGSTWESKARKVTQDFLNKFSVAELPVEVNVWKRVETNCLSHATSECDVFFEESSSNIVIVGLKATVSTLSSKITNILKVQPADGFAKQISTDDLTAFAEETISVRSMEEVEFIESFMNLSEIPEVKTYGITVDAGGTESAPYLKIGGRKDRIQDAVKAVKQQLSFIVREKQTYSKAGEAKALKKNEANIKAKAKQLHCSLDLSTEQPSQPGPKKSFAHKINCIALTVEEGELQQCHVDMLICPMTSSLAFDNPIARQFLKAGGYQIQEVCRRFQREKQSLLPGDILLSDQGNLTAKSLIYAVLPQSGQMLGSCYLKSAILNSLQKSEEMNSVSVAMPVAGSGKFGFSVEESCQAIKEAILQFCSEHQNNPKNVKHVYVVDSDVKIVEEFDTCLVQLSFPSVSAPPTRQGSLISPVQTSTPNLKSDTSVTVQGVLVSLKRGDITKEQVDVIVNSNQRVLQRLIGVSKAIFDKAGKSVLDEFTRRAPTLDEVILTSGGNLSCKYIAQMFGPLITDDITTSVEKVLKLCESKKAATLAIPAIGTGGGGISAYESIHAIFTALENHLTHFSSSSLKEITVVAFENMTWLPYQNYFKERNRTSLTGTLPSRGRSTNRGLNSAFTIFKANLTEVQIGGVKIKMKKGNITSEAVEAIVNTTNSEMDSVSGVSGAILRAAGSTVEKECQKLSPLQNDSVAVTKAGNLPCTFIIHMLGPHSVYEVLTRVRKVLQQCELQGIQTVCFPAVGTGGGGVRSVEAIGAMLQAFEDHLSPRASSALKQIYVVINQDYVLQEFQQGLREWTAKKQGPYENDEEEEDGSSSEDEDDVVDSSIKQNKNKNDKKNKQTNPSKKEKPKKMNKDLIGKPSGFRHLAHVGLDPVKGFDLNIVDPVLKELFDLCGITDAQLQDKETSKVIYDFIERKGGVEAIKNEFRREVTKPPHPKSHQTPSKRPASFATEISAVTFPVATVEMFGKSSSDLAKVKTFLEDIISDECCSREVQSVHLSKLPDENVEAMVDLSRNKQVQLLVLSPGKLKISGKKDDVLEVILDINSFIQAATEREIQENEEKRIRETLCWEAAEGDTWVPLDSKISYKLELAFHKKEQMVTYENDGEVYMVDLKELKRVNKKGGSCRIKRTLFGDSDTAIIQPPPTWTIMEGKDLEIILLPPDSEEYTKIEDDFLASSQHPDLNPFQVVQIRRVQNKGQWQRYSVLKQEVDKKYPKQTNERFLYHGTTKDICQKINKNGFNRSFCGRNAVAHGEGTYFAKEAWYSCHDQYSNPDESGLKYIYRARVVTGLPCKSRQGMKEPDPLDPKDPRSGLYDCAVDDPKKPFIFVVFCDAGAYPDYLIVCKSM